MSTATGFADSNFQSTSSLPVLPTRPRIQSLDVLRAIALLCGLLVSVWWFGGLSYNQQVGLQVNPHGINYRLYSTIVLLFEGKMLSLISLVFGAGMMLYLSKQNTLGRLPVTELFIRRQMWLIAFGLVNGLLLLWSGDVLFHLGIMGILLFPFFRFSSRGLLIAATIATLIFCGKNYWRYADDNKAYKKYLVVNALDKKITQDSLDRRKKDSIDKINKVAIAPQKVKKDTLTKQQKADKQAWEGIVKNRKYDAKKDSGANVSMWKQEYGELLNNQLPQTEARQAQWTYRFGVWDMASMILLGMGLFKFGFFNQRFSRNQYLLLALLGLAIGIPLGLFRMYFNVSALMDYEKYIKHYWYPNNLFFPLEKVFTTLGYASLVMLLIHAKVLVPLWRALACVGQMALTNYLVQSIVCFLFFTGYGMGYFGRLNQWQLYMFVLEVWIVQVVYSVLWFRQFEYGPAEWLWRCLTYGEWIPFKKSATETVEPVAILS